MKTVTTLCLLLFLTTPAFAQLTKEDIRTIVKEEVTASEKRTREYIDLKIDGVEKSLNTRINELDKSLNARINDIRIIMIALIGLITAAIAIPQIVAAYRDRGQKEMERGQKAMQSQIDQLREQIEAMNQSINELMHQ